MQKLILIVAAIALVFSTTSVTMVNGQSPYDSGFAHGREDCQDIKSGEDQEDVYIFKEKYGPDKHTSVFMDGFYDGWYDAGCAVQELNDRLYPETYSDNNNIEANAYRDSFNDNQVVSQPQNQQAFTSQSNQCPQMVINGDCYVKQAQDVDNDFAQANRAENND